VSDCHLDAGMLHCRDQYPAVLQLRLHSLLSCLPGVPLFPCACLIWVFLDLSCGFLTLGDVLIKQRGEHSDLLLELAPPGGVFVIGGNRCG